ncbi:MAG: type IV toxin-antitoxin system AbiEi family antitoxin domain-containing protein [Spirochaetota bacterium]
MMTKEVKYLDTLYISDQLRNYASPKSKLTTMVQSGELIRVRQGLYIPGDSKEYSLKTLANKIYGPSYVSFESALEYYGIIPERVETVTSAVYNKNKNKTFRTPVGTFIYMYVHPRTYPYGVIRISDNDSPFIIATKEKALCDTLSKIKGIETVNQVASLLEKDLRVDNEIISSLSGTEISFFESLYRKKIITLFKEYLSREKSSA